MWEHILARARTLTPVQRHLKQDSREQLAGTRPHPHRLLTLACTRFVCEHARHMLLQAGEEGAGCGRRTIRGIMNPDAVSASVRADYLSVLHERRCPHWSLYGSRQSRVLGSRTIARSGRPQGGQNPLLSFAVQNAKAGEFLCGVLHITRILEVTSDCDLCAFQRGAKLGSQLQRGPQ